MLLFLISANLIRQWENPHLLLFPWLKPLFLQGHGIEFRFEAGNTALGWFLRNVFFYIGTVKFIIEVNKVGSGVVLRAVLIKSDL